MGAIGTQTHLPQPCCTCGLVQLCFSVTICGYCMCSTKSERLIAHSIMRVYQYGVPSQAPNPSLCSGKHWQICPVARHPKNVTIVAESTITPDKQTTN
ncbi:uncharacterized protein CC84DRAFT_519068 [Paraphaeosphaeria sporulosa]|uniref:Uncharacterized protein n=1 Tax=Paraphaeosphaeria sporulosa TaxID=1460663 RepID=A0A177CW94_9PLEO|nr:uncharacterized protein CC84DRAFT_519068 [Paraphaeosphaeria sporulosa]OAG11087.1 hypothetical protein CC84DRAFT_519068 [Paraphaeosphaeria sporulosa]